MPSYRYLALDASGGETSGTIEAGDERIARTRLREQGLRTMEISEVSGGGGFSIPLPFLGKKKVKLTERMEFTRQLATLIDAGLPLLRSLNILIEQQANPTFKEILETIRNQVQGGTALSDAMSQYPRVFDKLYISMVKAGEVGGVLEVVLDRLAEFAEKDQSLRTKVKGAMMYPAIMVVVATLVVIILMAFVIPQFTDLFMDMGVLLPLPTRMLIAVSDVIKHWWFLIIGGGIGGFQGFKYYIKTEMGERWWDSFRLKIPVFGELQRKMITARFTRTLGTLIQSGVPILQALAIVRDTAGNVIVAEGIDTVATSITEGESIATPLHKLGIFSSMVTNMIAVGEETGALDNMLMKIADNYDMIVEEAVKGLTSLMEPVIIVVMGVLVGFIVLALFLPLFQLSQAVKA